MFATSPVRTRTMTKQSASQPAKVSTSKAHPQVNPGISSGEEVVRSYSHTTRGDIEVLPWTLNSKNTGLGKREFAILSKKQHWLRVHSVNPPDEITGHSEAINRAIRSTLIFADEHAGTALCISPQGHVLTCAHCVEDVDEDVDATGGRFKWLLTSDGRAVKARVEEQAIDQLRDLALLTILAVQAPTHPRSAPSSAQLQGFPHEATSLLSWLPISTHPPRNRAALICIGQPGPLDLEISDGEAPRSTGYDILHVSSGAFRGYAKGQDRHDNSEIGALKHDCWTYWGHSGAPLVALGGKGRRGEAGEVAVGLIGVHSSWDETTGMRRGVGWEAILEFLNTAGPDLLAGEDGEGGLKGLRGRIETQRKWEPEIVDLTQESDE